MERGGSRSYGRGAASSFPRGVGMVTTPLCFLLVRASTTGRVEIDITPLASDCMMSLFLFTKGFVHKLLKKVLVIRLTLSVQLTNLIHVTFWGDHLLREEGLFLIFYL